MISNSTGGSGIPKKKKKNHSERLLEYYFVVGASPKSVDAICNRLSQKTTLFPRSGGKPYFANFAYKPKVIDRYPLTDYPESPLLTWVARACLPRGVRVRTKPPPPKFGWFVGYAPDGALLYGSYFVIYERLPLNNQAEPVYQPKALGLLSHFPMFYAFEVFLTCLWHSVPKNIITLEELLVHYFLDIPAPQSGRKISYDLGRMKVGLVRPTPLDLPVVELPRAVLFQRLSVDRIALLIKCILLEKRIILVSSTECELMAVGETLRSLIFPLKWKHLYIPLMNRNVGSKLHVHQGPFLVGVPRFMLRRPEFSKFPKHSIIVFLDKNEIRLMNTQKPVSDLTPLWPSEFKRGLQNVMEEAACVFTDSEQNNKERVYETLQGTFKFMTRILELTKTQKNFRNERSPFTRRFAETEIFKEFVKEYGQRCPQDKKLSKVFKHYMDNQKIALGFSLPARGTLAKIARSTEHYSSPFPTVSAKLVIKQEQRHRQKTSNIRAKKRPFPNKCNAQALEFLKQTLLSPPKQKAIPVDQPSTNQRLASKSRRISFLESRQTGSRAKSPEPAPSPNQLPPIPAEDQEKNATIVRELEQIIQQAKNSTDLNAFQLHMEQIQTLLSSSSIAPQVGDDISDEDILTNIQIDDSMLAAFQHIRTNSMSTIHSSSNKEDDSSDSCEDWDLSDDDDEDDISTAKEKSGDHTFRSSVMDGFRQLNEFDLDEPTRRCIIASQERHNELIGDGTIRITYDETPLLEIFTRNMK